LAAVSWQLAAIANCELPTANCKLRKVVVRGSLVVGGRGSLVVTGRI